jgi:hypothetical protein
MNDFCRSQHCEQNSMAETKEDSSTELNEIHHMPHSDLPLRSLPPLAALLAFERAAAQLSFRRAAVDLALSPSAISHQIRNLEAQFGVKLFTRDRRSVRLTAEGERFGEDAKKVFVIVLNWLRDGEGELKLVLVMVGLVVLPQWLTYVLSGLSGSASPPVFVSQVTDLAIWSLVKFSAALAGIVTAEPVVKLVMDGSFDGRSILDTIGLLGVAFLLVWVNSVVRYRMEHLYQRRAFRTLRRLHKFFTRFSDENSREGDGATGVRADQSIL